MQAITYSQYGPPEVMKLSETPKPIPGDNEVLIKVYAASVNPFEWHHLRGQPLFMRLTGVGLLKPKNQILGADVAGIVEAAGSSVTQFKPGDEVYGEAGFGSFAEYVCVREKNLALKPDNLSLEDAAAVPMAGLTALQGLRDSGQLQPGQNVLINGASGGVGTFAVQIARALGASVTAVCSTRNLELVRSIGADHVIDYTQEAVTQPGDNYDLIIDNVGNLSAADYERALKPGGIGVIIGFTTVGHMLRVTMYGRRAAKRAGKQVGSMLAHVNKDDLIRLKELIESGAVKPVIDKRYPLHQVPEAIAYVETGRARGKVVITVDRPDAA